MEKIKCVISENGTIIPIHNIAVISAKNASHYIWSNADADDSNCGHKLSDGQYDALLGELEFICDKYNIRGIKSKHAEGKLGEMIKEMKSTDKIEPKFKVGDKIQYSKGCGTIMTIEKKNGEYIFGNLGHTTIESGNKWYLVEQKPVWSEEELDSITAAINNLEYLKNNYVYHQMGLEPAITFLKSLKDRVQPQPKQEWKQENTGVPKQEWSEEDETYLDHIITAIKSYYTDDKGKENPWREELLRWLESLKDRVQPKVEWSEGDEEMLNLIIARLHSHPNVDSEEYDKEYNWLNYNLKSLRPHKQWKPTEEQMKALHNLNLTGGISYAGQGQELINLYNELKRLK